MDPTNPTPNPTEATRVADHTNLSVKVLYHDLWDGWKEIQDELKRRLPLMHISWTVFNIDVECKQLDNLVFEPAPPAYVMPPPKEHQWHNEPYLHILPVLCADRKIYDTTVSEQITQWLADKSQVEWIILYISLPNDPSRKATFFNTFHYMRRDHNIVRGQDRIVQIKVPGPKEKEDEDGWDRFLSLVKNAIVQHGQAGMSQCIQETRRLDAQRILPGWDFPQFFLVKEGLAFIYETFQMYEEALMQYDELEALFSSTTDLFPFGGDQPGDDSGQIFQTVPRGFRHMIIDRTISEFYFRQYVFTRQAKLLFSRSLPVQVAERGLRFIRGLEKDMAKVTTLKPVYIWAWAFGAYMDLAASCKPFAHLKPDPAKVSKERRKMQKKDRQQLNLLLADIYLNSSLLLQRIGVTLGFLPQDDGDYLFGAEPHVPFVAFSGYGGAAELNVHDPATDDLTGSEDESSELQKEISHSEATPKHSDEHVPVPTSESVVVPTLTITPSVDEGEKGAIRTPRTPRTPRAAKSVEKYDFSYYSLRQAVQQTAFFDRLYKAITKKAIRSYHAGHRQRSVNWLQYTLATMHFHRGTTESYFECMNLLSTVVKSHSLNNANEASAWPPLLFAAYNKLCECYRRAGHHEDYVDTLLHLLLYKELAPGPEYWHYYFSELLRVIHNPTLLPNLLAKEHFLSIIDIDLNVPQQIDQEKLPLQTQAMILRNHLTQRTRQFPLDAVIDIECTLTNKLPNELKINYLCLQMIILPEEENSSSSDDEDVQPEIPSERRLILERHDLVLKPLSTSKIQLQLKPHQVGTFVCNKMWIALGNLLLTRSIPEVAMREKKAGITVVPSIATLSLDVKHPPAMLLQQQQRLVISIKTNKDTFCQAQLEITRPPQPQVKGRSGKTISFLKPSPEKLSTEEKLDIIIDRDGTKSEVPVIVKRREAGLCLILPDSTENTTLIITLPVQADNSSSITHTVKVALTYAKVTGEQFTNGTGLQLHYQHPFKIEQVTIPVYRENQDTIRQAYLRAIVANVCGVPIKLIDYKLNLKALSDTHKLLNDPNEPVKGIVLEPDQKTSFLFDIAYDSTIPSKKQVSSSEQATLTLNYQIEAAGESSQIFSFTSKVYPVHSLVDLIIDIKYPKTGIKAKRVKFHWTVEVVAGAQLVGRTLHYSINTESKMWLIGAKQTGLAQLQSTSDPTKPYVATITGTLIPVCSGVLPLPTLKLDGIAPIHTRLRYTPEKGIMIFPASCLTSGCSSVPLTEEESKFLGSKVETTITEIQL